MNLLTAVKRLFQKLKFDLQSVTASQLEQAEANREAFLSEDSFSFSKTVLICGQENVIVTSFDLGREKSYRNKKYIFK